MRIQAKAIADTYWRCKRSPGKHAGVMCAMCPKNGQSARRCVALTSAADSTATAAVLPLVSNVASASDRTAS